MKFEKMNLEDLVGAEYNPRKISDDDLNKLKRSIEEFGYVEPIIFNERTGRIVGGHQRHKALKALGYEEIEVVKIDLDEQKEKALNIALNKISGEFDMPKLKDLLEELDSGELDITLTGFDEDELEDLMTEFHVDGEDSIYTDKVQAPIYEPTGDKPEIEQLYNNEKSISLIKRIEESDIPKEVKDFLKAASYRHIIFDYEKIAEFYAHSDKEVQELMEESALVIIDFKKAIENGFIQFTTEIMDFEEGEEFEV